MKTVGKPRDHRRLGSVSAQGLTLMTAAMLVIPAMDAAAKLLTHSLPLWQIVWARFFFHAVLLLPIYVLRHGIADLARGRPLLQIVRASLLVPATALFYAALASMPLADALAIYFVYPCLVTILAALFLADRVGVWRWTATVIGFLGALIVIQPGRTAMSEAALLVLVASVFIAGYMVLTRKLAGLAPPLVTMLTTGLVGCVMASFAALPVWQHPTPTEWGLMAVMGLASLSAHLMMVMAYERAPASLLAPFAYLEIVSATALGYLLFGDFPGATTWMGIAIIVASGLVIGWRERVRAVAERTVDGR